MALKPEPGSRQEVILAEYEAMAQGYDAGSKECGWSAPAMLVKTLERMGRLQPGMAVLDFATGTGALSEAFRHSAPGASLQIAATDLSPAMLEQCRAKNVADTLAQQDITKSWAAAKASKDIIAATGVAEYLTDDELARVVREAAQALKAGGTLAFTFLPRIEGVMASHQQEHSVSYVEDLFRDNGLALQTAQAFDAYQDSDGGTVKHVLAVGMKPA